MSPGILHAAGNVTVQSGSSFQVKLNGPTTPGIDYDQLAVAGTITAGQLTVGGNAQLLTSLGYAPSPTDSLTIIQAGSVANQLFVGLPNNAQFLVGSFNGTPYLATIHYAPTRVFLDGFTPVPEPAHGLLFGGLAAAAWRWRRRRTPPGRPRAAKAAYFAATPSRNSRPANSAR